MDHFIWDFPINTIPNCSLDSIKECHDVLKINDDSLNFKYEGSIAINF